MKVILGGVRGTAAVSGAEFLEFGGHSTSLLVQSAEGGVLVDAGSGLRVLGPHLEQPPRPSLMLMTHYHLDHLSGLTTFAPLYDPAIRLEFAAPDFHGIAPAAAIERLMSHPLWPQSLDRIPAHLGYRVLGDKGETSLEAGGLKISWCPLHHPGGCAAYRFDETATGASAVLATDVEWGQSSQDEKEALLQLCGDGPDLLIFDGQFCDEEYPQVEGWGHSTWQQAVEAARKVRARELLVTHHDPARTDTALAQIEAQLKQAFPGASLARQGQVIELA